MDDRLLRDLPLFSALTPGERSQLARIARSRTLAEGETLFTRYDVRRSLSIVRTGRIRVYAVFDGALETLALLEPKSFIGEQALVNPTAQHEYSAMADVASDVIELPGAEFLALGRREPRLTAKVLSAVVSVLADRLSHADTKLLTVYTTGRIANQSADIQALATDILRTVVRTVKARKGLFVLFRPAEQVGIVRVAVGYRTNLQGRRLRLARDPILGRLFRSAEELVITRSQIHRDPHWETPYTAPGMLAVPVSVGQTVLGAIVVGDKRDGEDFSVNNRLLASIVARQVAAAVEEAAVEEERRQTEELERVYIKPL